MKQDDQVSDAPAEGVEALSGHPEGAVLDSGEIIRGSYDEDGKLIGWHKEAPEGNR